MTYKKVVEMIINRECMDALETVLDENDIEYSYIREHSIKLKPISETEFTDFDCTLEVVRHGRANELIECSGYVDCVGSIDVNIMFRKHDTIWTWNNGAAPAIHKLRTHNYSYAAV